MNIPGLLIEYLMTGCVALFLWYPSLEKSLGPWGDVDLLQTKVVGSLVVIPLVYVVGAVLDSLGSFLLFYPKREIRARVREKWNQSGRPLPAKEKERLITVYLLATQEVLGKEFEARSSRDRIARGAALVLATTSALAFAAEEYIYSLGYYVAALTLFTIWYRAEKASYSYKLQAWYLSAEKGQADIAPQFSAGHAPETTAGTGV